MRSNHEPLDDQAQARREHEARRLLLDHGANRLARRPWQPGPVPPSAVDLIQFFLWHSSSPSGDGHSGSPSGDGYSGSPSGDGYSGSPSGDGYSSSPSGDGYSSSPSGDGHSSSSSGDGRSGSPSGDGQPGSALDGVPGSTADDVRGSPSGDANRAAAVAALRLFPAARAELEQLEAGLMFEARGLGLTWAEMARALGLNSPQACQQRLDRLTARGSRPADGQAT